MFEALADSGGSAAEFCSSLGVLDTLVQVPVLEPCGVSTDDYPPDCILLPPLASPNWLPHPSWLACCV